MKPNPPIKGHHLIAEGHVQKRYLADDSAEQYGGCQCGARPDGWPNVSIGATKRWHRDHKNAVLLERVKAARARGRA